MGTEGCLIRNPNSQARPRSLTTANNKATELHGEGIKRRERTHLGALSSSSYTAAGAHTAGDSFFGGAPYAGPRVCVE